MPNFTISVSERDADYIKRGRLSPTKLFRRAVFQDRMGKLYEDSEVMIDPVDEIVKLRMALNAQNQTLREQSSELRRLKDEKIEKIKEQEK